MDGWVDVVDYQVLDDALSQECDPCAHTSGIGLDVAGIRDAKNLDDVSEEASKRGFSAGVSQRRECAVSP